MVECVEVGVEIGLVDVTVVIVDVVDEVADFDSVETFGWVLYFGVVYLFDGIGSKVDDDVSDMDARLPVLLGLFIEGFEFFTSGSAGPGREDRIGQWSGCWQDVGASIPCCEDCGGLEFAQVSFV